LEVAYRRNRQNKRKRHHKLNAYKRSLVPPVPIDRGTIPMDVKGNAPLTRFRSYWQSCSRSVQYLMNIPLLASDWPVDPLTDPCYTSTVFSNDTKAVLITGLRVNFRFKCDTAATTLGFKAFLIHMPSGSTYPDFTYVQKFAWNLTTVTDLFEPDERLLAATVGFLVNQSATDFFHHHDWKEENNRVWSLNHGDYIMFAYQNGNDTTELNYDSSYMGTVEFYVAV
jgi:hypothetical protein